VERRAGITGMGLSTERFTCSSYTLYDVRACDRCKHTCIQLLVYCDSCVSNLGDNLSTRAARLNVVIFHVATTSTRQKTHKSITSVVSTSDIDNTRVIYVNESVLSRRH